MKDSRSGRFWRWLLLAAVLGASGYYLFIAGTPEQEPVTTDREAPPIEQAPISRKIEGITEQQLAAPETLAEEGAALAPSSTEEEGPWSPYQ